MLQAALDRHHLTGNLAILPRPSGQRRIGCAKDGVCNDDRRNGRNREEKVNNSAGEGELDDYEYDKDPRNYAGDEDAVEEGGVREETEEDGVGKDDLGDEHEEEHRGAVGGAEEDEKGEPKEESVVDAEGGEVA
ncbi:hypothetical protein M5K25_017300 [Dendrobium thyrsiflorum]|uniref:Uncharacterized protein n=1 Tax=Dendrobium thyrsiflorum TaxID=117978 RepID=A0ABD0UU52_DENTH